MHRTLVLYLVNFISIRNAQHANFKQSENHIMLTGASYIGMQIDMLQYTMENTLHNECIVTGHSLRVINSQRNFSRISALTHNVWNTYAHLSKY